MVGEVVTECPGSTACDCSKCWKSCRVRKLLEPKHGLTIYHAPHSVTSKSDDDVMRIKPAPDNIIILHNNNEDDIAPADVLPEFDISTVRCPRCRYVMTRARAVLKAVKVVERKSIKCFCDLCDLEQLSRHPCRFCQRVIKQFEDIKLKDKEIKQQLESLLANATRFLQQKTDSDTVATFVKKEESTLLNQYKKKKLRIRSLDKVFSSNEVYDEKHLQTSDKSHKTRMSSILKSPLETRTDQGPEANIVHSESIEFIEKRLPTTDKSQKTRMSSILKSPSETQGRQVREANIVHSEYIEGFEKQTTDESHKNRMSSLLKSPSETQVRQGRHTKIVHSESKEFIEKRLQTMDKSQRTTMSSILKSPLETQAQKRQAKIVRSESIEGIEKRLQTTDKSHKTRMSSILKSPLETQGREGRQAKIVDSESVVGIEKRLQTTEKSHKIRMSSILKSPLETQAHQGRQAKMVHSESEEGIEKRLQTTDKSHKTKMSSIFKYALETQARRGREAKIVHSESIVGSEKLLPTADKSHKTKMSSILKSTLETQADQVSKAKKVHRSESIIGIGTGGMRVFPSELGQEKFMYLFPAKPKQKKNITVSEKSSHQIVQDTKRRLNAEIKRKPEKKLQRKDEEKKINLEKEQKVQTDTDTEPKKLLKGHEGGEPDNGEKRDETHETEKGSNQITHKGTKKITEEKYVSTSKDSSKLHGKYKEHVITQKKDKDAHETKSKGKGKKEVEADHKDISTSMTDNQATETSGVGTSFAGSSADNMKDKDEFMLSETLEKEVDLLNKVLSKQEKGKKKIRKSKKEVKVYEIKQKPLPKKKTKKEKTKRTPKKTTKISKKIGKEANKDDKKEESSGDESQKMDIREVRPSKIVVYNKSRDDLILKLIAKHIKPLPRVQPTGVKEPFEGPRKIIKSYRHVSCGDEEEYSNDTDRNIERETSDVIVGVDIVKQRIEPPPSPEPPSAFHSIFTGDLDKNKSQKDKHVTLQPDGAMRSVATPGGGPVFYKLSDRKYITNGWTVLPVEKVIRKMNVYRMHPSHPEFDWFEYNKKKGSMLYDTGEKLADFTDDDHGRWYYKNGKLALDYYASAGTNGNQRFVIYSSGEPDDGGRSRPITVLGMFDYKGNGIVFDHNGKTRLKYNQTEGVVIDREIGPGCHWLWHSLNEPPELQQVMIDSKLPFKDPDIYRYEQEEKPADDENMLSIEFNNYIKKKFAKVTEKFKPYQIKMKALKINKQFSLRVLDQQTIYLFFRDGSNTIRLNLGMILDHNEIVETSTSDLGDVSIDIEKQPAATESLVNLQLNLERTRLTSRLRTERELRLKPAPPGRSVDNLIASACKPHRSPLLTSAQQKNFSKCNIAIANSLYNNTRLI